MSELLESLPRSVPELIKQLDELIPNKCPSISMSDREIWMYAGERRVVNLLLSLLDDHRDNILKAEILP